MKTLTITIISLLLIVIAFMTPALAGPASVLLQEGLYAEEIEGDLDGAIKIYEQVLAEAKDVEQTAAQATYRIGLCHLKKGDKTKAASYFQSILREYPDNEQLNARAKEQLNKVGTPAEVPFGSTAASLYEKLPPEVIQFVGNKYGSICAEETVFQFPRLLRHIRFCAAQGGNGILSQSLGQGVVQQDSPLRDERT